MDGFQSGPESDEKWWEHVWFQHASKNDGLPWQNGWFQKLMDSLAKWMVSKVVHRHMKSAGKIDGFKSGPENDEKWWENVWF